MFFATAPYTQEPTPTKSLRETSDATLIWTQTKQLPAKYELHADADTIASLQIRTLNVAEFAFFATFLFIMFIVVSQTVRDPLVSFILLSLVMIVSLFLWNRIRYGKTPRVIGKTYDGEWVFNRVRFSSRITAQPKGSEEVVASFKPTRMHRGGTVELPLGRVLTWNKTKGDWAFKEADGTNLVRFTRPMKLQDRWKQPHLWYVQIDPSARRLTELSILALLGLYLIVSQRADGD